MEIIFPLKIISGQFMMVYRGYQQAFVDMIG